MLSIHIKQRMCKQIVRKSFGHTYGESVKERLWNGWSVMDGMYYMPVSTNCAIAFISDAVAINGVVFQIA